MSSRLLHRLLPLALMAALAAGLSTAQRPNSRSWAREMVERLAGRLSLTESQKQQALAIYMALEEDTQPLERKIGEQRLALREAVRNGAPEWQIDQIAGALGALAGQVAALETKADAKFYALLNAEQREKWSMPFGGRGQGGWPKGPPPR